MTELEKLKKMTGEKDEGLLQILLEDAEAFVLSYTNRTHLVSGLDKAVRDLAVIALNRMGTEGEAARTGSGESYTFNDAPKQIYDVLNRYRLAHLRLKRSRLVELKHCPLEQKKDNEGGTYIEYGSAVPFRAEMWAAGGRIQSEMYRIRLPNIRNLRIDGTYTENSGKNGKLSYTVADGPTISVNDGICINGDQPDYKVIAIYPYRYLTLEVEKL